MTLQKVVKDQQMRDKLWNRFRSAMDRGHDNYTRKAKYMEDMYLGGGRQWSQDPDVVAELEAAGKPVLELNLIQSSLRTIKGYQTQSRMNISYQPRGTGDLKISEILTKIALYELDQNKFPWIESQVFEDGLIQGRGYFDIRMDYEEDLNGRIKVEALDPLDVIPDADAKSYDPKDWNYVIITKWIPIEDLKVLYPKKAKEVEAAAYANESAWGVGGDEGAERNTFSEPYSGFNYYRTDADEIFVRVLDVQHVKVVRRDFYYDPMNDTMYPVPDNLSQTAAKRDAKKRGWEVLTRTTKRIRWTVMTQDCTLHDDWSPYDHFTIVPYFPIFRRGQTMGLVENLVSNQEMMNKVYSQILHIVNTTANSGWLIEQGSLVNMDVEDLEQEGASTGLVIEYKKGYTPPQKIEPNQIPTGLKDIFNTSRDLHDQILGVNESFRGEKTNEVSGQAIQQRVSQTAVGLTSVIDNLFYTRNLVASIILNLIQNFYTEQRSYRIVVDPSTEEVEEFDINQEEVMEDEEGNIIAMIHNDITVGKYDIVIADVPTQVTYLNAQFQQALEMRKYGIQIPDDEMIRMSTLSRRDEIAKKVSGEASEAQEQMMQKQMEMLEEQVNKLRAEIENKGSDDIKKMAEVAKMIAENPAVAPILENVFGLKEQMQATQVQPQQMPQQQMMPMPQQQPALGSF